MPGRELAEGVWLLPARLGAARVYAVVDGGEWLLIDAGNRKRTPAVVEEFRREHRLPFPKLILVTHWHPDHLGGAWELRRRYGCPIALGAEDHPPARGENLPTPHLISHFEQLFAANSPVWGRADLAPADGETFTVGGLSLLTLAVPGHTPGHRAWRLPERGVLFTGDALGGKGGIILDLPGLFAWDAPEQRRSLACLARLPFSLWCGGHILLRSPELPALFRHRFKD